MGDPNMAEMLRLELRTAVCSCEGFKRWLQGGQPLRTRLLIIPDILRKIHDSWMEPSLEWNTIMLWAAMSLCFYGFLWAGEAVIPADDEFDSSQHLSYVDVAVDNVGQLS